MKKVSRKSLQYVKQIFKRKTNYLTSHKFIIACSFLVGMSAGFMAYLLRSAVYYFKEILQEGFQMNQHWHIILLPIVGISLTVFLKYFINAKDTNFNLSDLLHAISKRNSHIKPHKIYSSIVGATLTTGFGGSVGLEAPVILSGASIGSTLGRWFKVSYKEVTLLLACGSAGAIAAIFNTPIAAIIFALEVLMLDITRFSLVPLLISSLTGAITARLLFSESLILVFPPVEQYATLDLVFFVGLGIIAGFLSYYFTRIYLFFSKQIESIKKQIFRTILGGVTLGGIIYLFPSLYGEGYTTMQDMISGNYLKHLNNSIFSTLPLEINILYIFFIALFLLKVVATSFTINAGGIGGIIAPAMFTGSMLGLAFTLYFNHLNIVHPLSITNFSLVGMASMLSGILHAPLTSMFLIAEMTNSYQLFLPLMLATTISYIVSKSLLPDSINTIQLAKKGELITHNKDRAILNFMKLDRVLETNFSPILHTAKLNDLVDVVAHSNRNVIPVINEDNLLMGTIQLDDIREIMFQRELYDTVTVSSLMVTPTEYIQFDDNMHKVIEKFQKTNAWNLPVVYKGKYMGFISKSNMFNEYRKYLVDLSDD